MSLADSECAKLAFVVNAGSVDHDYRAERKQFHGFQDRIGGGSSYVGYDGKILSGQGVDDA